VAVALAERGRSAILCHSWPKDRSLIGADRLCLAVDGQALLDDLNPYAPDGWWAAVDRRKGRCSMVVILRSEDADLFADNAGDQIAAQMGSGCSMYAWLPIMTFLEV
jgi:hypothetical protein